MELRKAERKKAKLKIGIAGPSGSGKTYSALRLARGLATSWDKICLIDTENGSWELYSNLGDYNVITLTEFKPSDYISAIEIAEKAGMEVIIIDSITHEWKYLLDQVDKLTQTSTSKNSYTVWGKITPHHDKFVQAILQANCHMITTVRSKQDYDMGKNEYGKATVTKVGMKQETRDWFEYELTVSFDIDIKHNVTTSKDRTQIFKDETFVISEETGEKILQWADSWSEKVEVTQ